VQLFSLTCVTCKRRLKVTDPAAIGTILACPGCGSMVEVRPPAGWHPDAVTPVPLATAAPSVPPNSPPPLPKKVAPATPVLKPLDADFDVEAAVRGTPAPSPPPAKPASVTPPVVPASAAPTAGSKLQVVWLSAAAIGAAIAAGVLVLWMMLPGDSTTAPAIAANDTKAPTKVPDRPNTPDVPAVPANDSQATTPAGKEPNAILTAPITPPVVDPMPSATPKVALQPPAAPAPPPMPPGQVAGQPFGDADDELDPPEPGTGLAFPRPAVELNWSERLKDPLAGLNAQKLSLAALADLVADLGNGPVALDVDALREIGLTADTPLAIKAGPGTLGTALTAGLSPWGLKAIPEGNHLLITRNVDRNALTAIPYSVADLARDEAAAKELAVVIQRLVAPGTWEEAGGAASIQFRDNTLTIKQSPAAHGQILFLCEKLRVARGLPIRSRLDANWFRLEPRVLSAQAKLQKPVTALFFQPTPLTRVLEFLERQSGVRLLVDWRALEVAGLPADLETTLKSDKQPLAVALAAALEPHKLTTRVVDDHTLLITTAKGLARREIELHRVRDVLSAQLTGQQLVERVQLEINPKSWNVNGGQGVAFFDATSHTLIVSHSPAVQLQTVKFLDQLRSQSAARPAP